MRLPWLGELRRRLLSHANRPLLVLIALSALGLFLVATLFLGRLPTSPTVTPGGETGARGTPGSAAEPGQPQLKSADHLDVIIRNGVVIDGTGAKPFRADIGIIGDHVVYIGNLDGHRARREINARGLYVTPGFINTHSHTYELVFANPDATSALRQGITLEIGGVDGRSPSSLADHFELVQRTGVGVNYAMFVGQGSVRIQVLGVGDREPSPGELAKMEELVRQAIRDGALGLSSGLEYVPGKYTSTEELVHLATAAVEEGGPGVVYSTHMRSESDDVVMAVAEALRIGRESGAAVQLSHLKLVDPSNWDSASEVLALVEESLSQGQLVWANVYPYLVPDYMSNIKLRYVASRYPPDLITVRRTHLNEWVGRSLPELAVELGVEPAKVADQLLTLDPDMTVVVRVISPDFLEQALQRSWVTLCNDASAKPRYNDPASSSRVHPRTYGAFPRFLSVYVRDKQLLNWPEAIRLLTGRPAEVFGLANRGLLREGYKADVVVFSPDEIRDTATYGDPQSYSEGIYYVLVNGIVAVEEGERVEGVRAGQVVRRLPKD